ncbi:MAG: Lrp/AsnC family transcriptional regulator, partial [Candidatus Baldrarchaeia archaeon]
MEKFLDEWSLRILRELYKNSKITYKKLSKKVGISTTSCYHKVRDLEKQGIIKTYTIEIDAKKLGFPVKTLIEVKTRTGVSTEVVKVLGKYPNI